MSGVKPELKQVILADLGFLEGTLPFKYLGKPLSSKKLTIAQCMPFVERITERGRCWSAKLSSYTSRLELIKSVLFGIQSYCAQIFLLPKRFLKLVEATCRSSLWSGHAAILKKSLVSWAKTCLSKAAGGQNVMNICLWNESDNGDLSTRLAAVVTRQKFLTKHMYVALFPVYVKVPWKSLVMQKHIHPRHRFNLWLAIQRRLVTVERLLKFGFFNGWGYIEL
ncbi:uncharacterized protein LOC132046234 [Lycium ferocissimum]|uniref:uncharacterized protein LOC132046234 n=1 Tax=Lycium ferocissimum TaxID=112874 RepID=UPI0028162AC6|nr:uncharacterized protein LOC132046234 [Lycium ferocissimum]